MKSTAAPTPGWAATLGVPGQAFVVIAPGLHARDAGGEPPPVIASLQRRARRLATDRVGIHALVTALLPHAGDETVAQCCRRAEEQVTASGPVLRADPVHLAPDRDTLVMTTADALALSHDDALGLADTVNARLGDEGFALDVADAERWYLHVNDAAGCDAPAPEAVGVGATFESALPTGSGGRRWRALLNELQMLFHDHPVNTRREGLGLPAVNSVWLWGGTACGRPPRSVPAWSDHPLVRGAWATADEGCAALPGDAAEWTGDFAGGPGLVATDTMQRALARGDATAWREARASFAGVWLDPLDALLRRGAVSSVCLFADDGAAWLLDAPRRWWSLPWRRRRVP